jgi:hypothetical protein
MNSSLDTNNDNVNHPSHYTSSPAKCQCGRTIECIDVTRHQSFAIGNAMKYLWRSEHKGKQVEDLEKAVWYINDEIQRLERQQTTARTFSQHTHDLANQAFKPKTPHPCEGVCECIFPSLPAFMDDKVDEALGIGDS